MCDRETLLLLLPGMLVALGADTAVWLGALHAINALAVAAAAGTLARRTAFAARRTVYVGES